MVEIRGRDIPAAQGQAGAYPGVAKGVGGVCQDAGQKAVVEVLGKENEMRFKNGKVVKDERLIGFMKTMPRYFRRNLCRNLGMSWQKYREMEGYKPKTSGLYIPPLFDLLYGKLRKIKNKMARHSRRVNRMRAA